MEETQVIRLINLNPMLNVSLAGWLKHEGDFVRRGEPLYIVETRKGAYEVKSDAEGTVERLLVPEGGEVEPGCEIAIVRCAPSVSAVG
ncbi:MAG: lipoyl domain-containing protein [Chloroflexi bacterium]|nr:lipoyl domain-containing protein [Chloroflexota bacterium]